MTRLASSTIVYQNALSLEGQGGLLLLLVVVLLGDFVHLEGLNLGRGRKCTGRILGELGHGAHGHSKAELKASRVVLLHCLDRFLEGIFVVHQEVRDWLSLNCVPRGPVGVQRKGKRRIVSVS